MTDILLAHLENMLYYSTYMYFMDIITASINDVICLNVEKFSPYKAVGNHPFCKYLSNNAFIQWIYVNRSAKCKGHLKEGFIDKLKNANR